MSDIPNIPIRLLVADDHPMILDGLKTSLSREDTIDIVAQAQNGAEVLDLLGKHTIDVILLDINMPGMNGFETLNKIVPDYPDVKIIILSMYDKPEFIHSLVENGASGYLLKNTDREEMIYAIQKVNNGNIYFSEDVKRILRKEEVAASHHENLTKREKEILRLIAQEKTTSEIAEMLFISTHTVDTHRKNLLSKLGVKNAAGLVKFAIEYGITRDF